MEVKCFLSVSFILEEFKSLVPTSHSSEAVFISRGGLVPIRGRERKMIVSTHLESFLVVP